MVRLLLYIMCICVSLTASSQYRVVIDPYCIEAVSQNLATQKAIEDQHNKRLDSIASKQNKLEQYTVSMATIKELYKVTMENVSGFGTESKYYVEIGRCALDIILDVPELVKVVNKAKFANKLLCLNELTNVVAQTQQLVGDFVNIVNNSKIDNPLKGQGTAEKKSDGYNLLDRYERLTLANRIYSDLMNIRYKIQGMMAMAQYATMNDLFFAIDPEGWANVMVMKNQVNGLVLSWNGIATNTKFDKWVISDAIIKEYTDLFNWGK